MIAAVALPSRRVWECMGTAFSLDVRGGGVSPSVIDDVVQLTLEVDALFSTYRPDSQISRLAAGSLDLRNASPQVRDVLLRCDELRLETGGYFDAHASGRLDPSGYVKGWAIQSISEALLAAGSTSHCVNGGGDVQCVGSAGPDEPWKVGIAHPLLESTFVDVVSGYGLLAVATSGTAERGRHVVDPHSATRPRHWASVTVIGREIHLVDAYATACLAMGDAAPDWLRERRLTAVLVRHDSQVERVLPTLG